MAMHCNNFFCEYIEYRKIIVNRATGIFNLARLAVHAFRLHKTPHPATNVGCQSNVQLPQSSTYCHGEYSEIKLKIGKTTNATRIAQFAFILFQIISESALDFQDFNQTIANWCKHSGCLDGEGPFVIICIQACYHIASPSDDPKRAIWFIPKHRPRRN